MILLILSLLFGASSGVLQGEQVSFLKESHYLPVERFPSYYQDVIKFKIQILGEKEFKNIDNRLEVVEKLKQDSEANQKEINDLKQEISDLRSLIKNLNQSNTSGANTQNVGMSKAELFDNIPNPFEEITVIPYLLPNNYQEA